MCVYVCIYLHTPSCMCIYTRIHTHTDGRTTACIHTYTYLHTQVPATSCTHAYNQTLYWHVSSSSCVHVSSSSYYSIPGTQPHACMHTNANANANANAYSIPPPPPPGGQQPPSSSFDGECASYVCACVCASKEYLLCMCKRTRTHDRGSHYAAHRPRVLRSC